MNGFLLTNKQSSLFGKAIDCEDMCKRQILDGFSIRHYKCMWSLVVVCSVCIWVLFRFKLFLKETKTLYV